MAKKCYPTKSVCPTPSCISGAGSTTGSTINRIVELYIISCRPCFITFATSFKHTILSGGLSISSIAKEFFKNNHFWALKSFRKPVYMTLLSDFIRNYPATLSTFSCFEDLYDWAESWMKRKYVSQLYIYDIALRFAILDPTYGRLMPSSMVYIHAKPMAALKILSKKGYLPFKVKGAYGTINYSSFPAPFNLLTAYEIEDLSCHIGKSMERLSKGVTGSNSFEKDLDKLVVLL